MSHTHLQLLDSLTTPILLVNDEFSIVYMNSAAEDLFANSKHHMQHKKITFLLQENPDPLPKLQEALEQSVSYTKRQIEIVLFSGKVINTDYTVTPLPDYNEAALLIEFHPLDRLLKINREETLLSQYEVTRELLRGLAHEIKNPLGGIRGAAQLLANQLDKELHEYTDIMIEEADRLRNLVDRMLVSNQLPDPKMVNIHEVLERVFQLIQAESHGGIDMQRDYDPSIPECLVDREQILQAVLNITRNAWQALKNKEANKGCITLATRALRNYAIGNEVHRLVCRIEVMDNGPGIPENLQENIFYPMISGRADGTGLGLAIAQAIIARHKGIIEFISEPGCTRFIILLPIAIDALH